MLLDSNTIIYAIKPEFAKLRTFIAKNNPAISAISYIEVLGYHKLTVMDERDFVEFFNTAKIIPISQLIIDQAVLLRKRRKMSVGDSIISATAMVNNLILVTANTVDFQWIENLTLINPLEM